MHFPPSPSFPDGRGDQRKICAFGPGEPRGGSTIFANGAYGIRFGERSLPNSAGSGRALQCRAPDSTGVGLRISQRVLQRGLALQADFDLFKFYFARNFFLSHFQALVISTKLLRIT